MSSAAIGTLVIAGAAWGALAAGPLVRRAVREPLRRRTAALRGVRQLHASRFRTSSCSPRVRVLIARVGAPLRWWRERHHVRARREAIERSLPLALDVLTVAARAGYTPRLALQATAQWSPDTLAHAFCGVEDRCRLGAGFADALDELADREPVLAPVAQALAVAERSGAPTADLLARLAGESRAGFRRRAEAHARRVPVRLLFPLVFLVLPAFGLLTVVPALLLGLRDH